MRMNHDPPPQLQFVTLSTSLCTIYHPEPKIKKAKYSSLYLQHFHYGYIQILFRMVKKLTCIQLEARIKMLMS